MARLAGFLFADARRCEGRVEGVAMEKIALIAVLAAALLAVALMSGCEETPEMLDGNDYVDRSGMEIVSFSYSKRGSTADSFASYQLEAQGDGDSALLTADFIVYGEVEASVGAEELDKLHEIIVAHDLDRWDGFDESDSMVLDGSGFSLSYVYADGSIVSAHGSNAFPEGYAAARDEIEAVFNALLEPYLAEFEEEYLD